MRVYVFDKNRFDQLMRFNNIDDSNVEERTDIFLISIVDTSFHNPFGDGPEAKKFGKQLVSLLDHHFKEDHKNVMNLEFDDCEHDGEASPTNKSSETKAFSKEQAAKLFSFIKKHREKETCIVHCMGGISRSGAVATFINGYAKGDWETFKRDNPQISPNGRVHRMLNQAKYNE